VETATVAGYRGPIEINRPGGIVALLWAGLVVEAGFLAMAVGWAPDGPVTQILNLLLWPGSLLALVVLGALPRRGGLLLGLIGGLLVGLTCAIVLATLPSAQLPLEPPSTANRVYSIIEAVWALPIAGMALAAVGIGARRLVTGQWRRDRELRSASRTTHRFAAAVFADNGEGDRQSGAAAPAFVPMGLAMAAGAATSSIRATAARD
jgi:hypothetical protein